MNFKDKVVVITGGTSGIGKQTAIEFSRKGAHVVAFTVDKEEVCKQAIKEIGNEAFYIHCDVSKEEDVKKAIEEVVLKYGRLDCAFNNAGIGPDGVRMPYESLTEISEKTWDLVVDVDMKGVFLCLKYELLQMQKQGFGTIVNTASIGGYKMAPGFAAYGPAKAAVIALTEMAALENAAFGIRVNAIAPGFFLTEQNRALLTNEDGSYTERGNDVIRQTPFKRFGRAEELCGTIQYLISEASSFVTGTVAVVDGGFNIFAM